MTETTRLQTLIMVDEEGHMTSFTLHSQKEEIIDFILDNQNHRERLDYEQLLGGNEDPIQVKRLLTGMDFPDFLFFLQDQILQRGIAELSFIKYTQTEDDPF